MKAVDFLFKKLLEMGNSDTRSESGYLTEGELRRRADEVVQQLGKETGIGVATRWVPGSAYGHLLLTVEDGGETQTQAFALATSTRSTPAAVNQTIGAWRLKRRTDQPLVLLLPFLSEGLARSLARDGVNAMDVCGNLLIKSPPIFIQHLGRPNRFPANAGITKIFAGTSSLVPRALLSASPFPTATALRDWVRGRGGSISKGTISKVMRVLNDEMWTSTRDGVRILFPDDLLDAFADQYSTPEGTRSVGVLEDIRELADVAGEFTALDPLRYSVGASSKPEYVLYTRSPTVIQHHPAFVARRQFANVTIVETSDPGVEFDLEVEPESGLRFLPKLETYLQLTDSGSRWAQWGEQIRPDLLARFQKE